MTFRHFAGAVLYVAGLVTVVSVSAADIDNPTALVAGAAAVLIGYILQNTPTT